MKITKLDLRSGYKDRNDDPGEEGLSLTIYVEIADIPKLRTLVNQFISDICRAEIESC